MIGGYDDVRTDLGGVLSIVSISLLLLASVSATSLGHIGGFEFCEKLLGHGCDLGMRHLSANGFKAKAKPQSL